MVKYKSSDSFSWTEKKGGAVAVTLPVGKVRRIGSKVHPQFAFPKCTKRREVLWDQSTCVFICRWPWCPTGGRFSSGTRSQQQQILRSDRERKRRCGDHVIFLTTQTLSRHKIYSSVSSVCVSMLFHRQIFVFLSFFSYFCRVLEASSSPPLAPGESSGVSHGFLGTLYRDTRQKKSTETAECLTWTSAFTHAKYRGTAEFRGSLKVV